MLLSHRPLFYISNFSFIKYILSEISSSFQKTDNNKVEHQIQYAMKMQAWTQISKKDKASISDRS